MTLLNGNKDDKNTPEKPNQIKLKHSTIKVAKKFNYQLPPYSLSVIRLKTS